MPSRASLQASIGLAKTSHGSGTATRAQAPTGSGTDPGSRSGGGAGSRTGTAGLVTGMWISRFGSPIAPIRAPSSAHRRQHILRDVTDLVEGCTRGLAVEPDLD